MTIFLDHIYDSQGLNFFRTPKCQSQETELLILDDFGLQAFDNHARDALMDIIDERFSTQSTIICSQIPVSAWYDIIEEGTIADAILDRLVNSSHRIDLKGESLRKKILENQ